MLIACLGIGCEYVLSPIAREGEKRGHTVVEIDMYDPDWRARAAALPQDEFILITSHHPYLDGWLHAKGFGIPADIESVAGFIAQYRPLRSYFIPHDLAEPILPAELGAMAMFDGLLMPDDRAWFLNAYVPVTVVGWAKAQSGKPISTGRVVAMPSDVTWFLNQPPERFIDIYKYVLGPGVIVKFAQIHGIERLEAQAQALGATVISTSVDSTSVMAGAACVVTNGRSSIISEAAMLGVPVLCLLDGIHPADSQRKIIAATKQARLLPPVQAASWISEQVDAWQQRRTITPDDRTMNTMTGIAFDKLFTAIDTPHACTYTSVGVQNAD
ncbi:hypothetical protein [Komagataeibacter sp. FNDCR2]|uniref:hypothetical protein n=1 Tax=Komagataeibacter sp. FNDCR2 TaxID=2878682 RepID=UPI001E5E6402|nr:hypothetical protein [Komagataeibacter sp. FNDCR2]MCE2574085.1 hypothetical protein [Komagataeibacter sp. FNDCR2]